MKISLFLFDFFILITFLVTVYVLSKLFVVSLLMSAVGL